MNFTPIPLLALTTGIAVSGHLHAASANSKGFDISTLDCKLTDSLSVKLDKSRYRIGEGLILEITPDSDAYVTVLDHGSDPSSPHRDHALYQNQRMNKGAVYRFPEHEDQMLEVSGPTGENTFEIIASVKPLKQPAGNSRNVNLIRKPKAEQGVETSNCTVSFHITE